MSKKTEREKQLKIWSIKKKFKYSGVNWTIYDSGFYGFIDTRGKEVQHLMVFGSASKDRKIIHFPYALKKHGFTTLLYP